MHFYEHRQPIFSPKTTVNVSAPCTEVSRSPLNHLPPIDSPQPPHVLSGVDRFPIRTIFLPPLRAPNSAFPVPIAPTVWSSDAEMFGQTSLHTRFYFVFLIQHCKMSVKTAHGQVTVRSRSGHGQPSVIPPSDVLLIDSGHAVD